jgi:hypothetical protein
VVILHCKQETTFTYPLVVLWWYFDNLRSDNRVLSCIRVGKDGAMTKSTVFCKFIRDEVALNLDMTGGYASYLNGKVERPSRTIAERLMASLINANRHAKDWCYAADHAADLYHVTLHYALKMPPFQAWYGERPNYKDIRIWGCRMLVTNHDMKKSEDHTYLGFFYGYAKSHSILRWCDDATYNVIHAHGARFLESDPLHPESSPGQQPLRLDSSYKDGDVICPDMTIDICDRAHLESEPFVIHIPLPNVGTPWEFIYCMVKHTI